MESTLNKILAVEAEKTRRTLRIAGGDYSIKY